ncbi:tRNA (5-methylaminomethyl-2-thiouridylate)-methyltransferase [Coriobacterium glomerans PW2]|uniref:tRNA-specific 2-thiouridylase MnmA n=1 Tax=Coriobacterium glomerans (strain ATCC 49209 / DSM 20642 / JCM 10262 / PW2) TaxID=700015 RepID=F2NBK0_CORGP|nr:tRNA 2-thiouridine(34) synthase MnmA [Coriobacterium glomerans]AEB06736.1 tRNA (5-methylaminomethyl-2-thiouridylate)-methyltransferase [Coriobacterium glomerans PW2]
MTRKQSVLVAMSGGVDSSVAAHLLLERGYTCIGATMSLYDETTMGRDPEGICGCADDVADARAVCARLGIEHRVFDFKDLFERRVIDRFVEQYLSGRTPNPCADCNRALKFGALLDRALEIGCDFIATGHYARIETREDSEEGTGEGARLLRCATDISKDQSYMLYSLGQERLRRVLLPLGELIKSRDVRRIAREQGFPNARKKDSQGICFIADRDFADFIERRVGAALPAGDILDGTGAVLGRHRGAIRYTIGQRKGLGVAAGHPLFVTALDARCNTVTLGEQRELRADALIAEGWIWTMPAEEMEHRLAREREQGLHVLARTRYHQRAQAARMSRLGRDDLMRIVFDEAQYAIAPGQAVVVYDDDIVLGGGTVRSTAG